MDAKLLLIILLLFVTIQVGLGKRKRKEGKKEKNGMSTCPKEMQKYVAYHLNLAKKLKLEYGTYKMYSETNMCKFDPKYINRSRKIKEPKMRRCQNYEIPRNYIGQLWAVHVICPKPFVDCCFYSQKTHTNKSMVSKKTHKNKSKVSKKIHKNKSIVLKDKGMDEKWRLSKSEKKYFRTEVVKPYIDEVFEKWDQYLIQTIKTNCLSGQPKGTKPSTSTISPQKPTDTESASAYNCSHLNEIKNPDKIASICKTVGRFPTTNCPEYYECFNSTKMRLIRYQCPDEFGFDYLKKICVPLSSANCFNPNTSPSNSTVY